MDSDTEAMITHPYAKLMVEHKNMSDALRAAEARAARLQARLNLSISLNGALWKSNESLQKVIKAERYGRELRKSKVSLGRIAGAVHCRLSAVAGGEPGTPEHAEFAILAEVADLLDKHMRV